MARFDVQVDLDNTTYQIAANRAEGEGKSLGQVVAEFLVQYADGARGGALTSYTVQRGDTTYTMQTANIGANQRPRRHIYENELQRIVVAWAAEHYPGDWPENPSHTNGTYWQQLTAHLRATITAATWHESDLKIIIKRLHAQRRTATPQSPISQSPISNPSPYKSLAQMDADGDIPPLAPRPSQPDTYSPVHPLQTALRSLLATYTAADLRTTATYRGGSRWFEARRLLAAAGIHYRDRDLVQALNNLADELEQRDRTQPAQPSIPSTPSIPSAPSPEPDDRINRARILINHYAELCDACERALEREPEYEALIGTPSDLLAAHRGMHAIVETLTEPIAKLQHLVETLIATRYESR